MRANTRGWTRALRGSYPLGSMDAPSPVEIAIVAVTGALILAPVVRWLARPRGPARPAKAPIPDATVAAMERLVAPAKREGSGSGRTVNGSYAGRRARVELEDARADGAAELRVTLDVGGSAILLARRTPLGPGGRPLFAEPLGPVDMPRLMELQAELKALCRRMATLPHGAAWTLDEDTDTVSTDDAGRRVWSELVAAGLPERLAAAAPETLSFAAQNELFHGRVVVWSSLDRIAFERLPVVAGAVLPLLREVAERVEAAR